MYSFLSFIQRFKSLRGLRNAVRDVWRAMALLSRELANCPVNLTSLERGGSAIDYRNQRNGNLNHYCAKINFDLKIILKTKFNNKI